MMSVQEGKVKNKTNPTDVRVLLIETNGDMESGLEDRISTEER